MLLFLLQLGRNGLQMNSMFFSCLSEMKEEMKKIIVFFTFPDDVVPKIVTTFLQKGW